jgi:hypothetical protein
VNRGIPTRYAGVQFRSRLEARWACFFDIVGLRWMYEPFDCRGYIPDFLVGDVLLCEIKPITWTSCYDDGPIVAARAALEAAQRELGRYQVALLGTGPFKNQAGATCLGETAQYGMNPHKPPAWEDWRDLHIGWWMSWGARKGEHVVALDAYLEGDKPLRFMRLGHDFERLWREAGNRVQWRGAEARP